MPSITPYGGVDEIGGNKFLLEDGRSRILLDFGTSFATLNDFYSPFLQPRGVAGLADYFATGLAPDIPGLYRPDFLSRLGRPKELAGVEAVLLTHAHLDHAGLLPLIRPDIPFLMSRGAKTILQMLEDTGDEEYLHYFENYRVRENQKGGWSKLTRREDDPTPRPIIEAEKHGGASVRVEGHDVDHSLPGARGYIVETSAGTVAYTGDFRFHGRNEAASRRFAQRFGNVDVLITEGTNLGSDDHHKRSHGHDVPEPLSEEDVGRHLAEAIAGSHGFVAANYPNRDVDRILSFYEASRKAGRRLLLTTKQAYLLQLMHDAGDAVPPLSDPNLGIYLARKGGGFRFHPTLRQDAPNLVQADYKAWERPFLDHANAFSAEDVARSPGDFVVYVDLFNMTEMVDLAPKGGTYLYSKTEPFNEEMDVDFRRLMNWLDLFKLRMVKAHASGHASREELAHMIDETRPRRIVPVHTHNVGAFEAMAPGRITNLRLGQKTEF